MAAGVTLLALAALAGCSMRSLDNLRSSDLPVDASFPDARGFDLAAPDMPPPSFDAAEPDQAPAPDLASDAFPFEAPPPVDGPPAGNRVGFVVGNLNGNPSDGLVSKRLTALGLQVVQVHDQQLAGFDPTTVNLIVVSKTAGTNAIGARYRNTTVPVIICEPLLYDDMDLVDGTVSTTRGTTSGVRTLNVEGPGNALTAGLSGTVTIASADVEVTWGTPTATAMRAASVVGIPERVAIFGYDTGVRMAGLNAPARRVGLFLSENSAASLTNDGWALFDAAVRWAIGR